MNVKHLVGGCSILGLRKMVFGGLAAVLLLMAGTAAARTPPSEDPFYQYTGSKPLADIAPGTVLKTRTLPYHIFGAPLLLKTTQILYRSTDQLGNPTVNVTSVITPLLGSRKGKLISYQSVYDSLNPEDEPSYAIAGGLTLGGIIPNGESVILVQLLNLGYSVTIPDTEGQRANFAAGREYGMNTLDAIRATFASSEVGLPRTAKVALVGYSGGAIATEWAAELAAGYAPDVSARIVGSSMGGVFVHPAHNLHYVEGSLVWSGVIPMALAGFSRAYQIDLSRYLNEYGKSVLQGVQKASVIGSLGFYPGLTWKSIAKPEYDVPEKIPEFVEIVNDSIMSSGGTPSAPMLIHQGAQGLTQGTLDDSRPGIGKGDGVMVAGDVRALALEYCTRGVKVKYVESALLDHVTDALVAWLPDTLVWIDDRFDGNVATENCDDIEEGNSLAPISLIQ